MDSGTCSPIEIIIVCQSSIYLNLPSEELTIGGGGGGKGFWGVWLEGEGGAARE